MTTGVYDFLVIGGGIAGASAAYELQARGRTLLLEREALPGQHTTGRSAAFLVESYGTRIVQWLTRAGRGFLEAPPEGFAPFPILKPCPSLWIAREDQVERLASQTRDAVEAGVSLREVSAEELQLLCPLLREGYAAAAVIEPGGQSIDVAGLLDGYLRGFRARGGEIVTRAEVTGLVRSGGTSGASWDVRCTAGSYSAGAVVNAAGAWAEQVAALAGADPIGLRPLRRTAITFAPPDGVDVRSWPCLIDADEDFYLKPEGVQLLASPCDETPSEPCDAMPDELGIALAAERVMRATRLEVSHIHRSWAGLRSFVADRSPVIGMDPALSGFFWLAGQGGFGIMTSSSAARALASLICDGVIPDDLKALGLTPELLGPGRSGLRPIPARTTTRTTTRASAKGSGEG